MTHSGPYVKELAWDSAFFHRKIGELIVPRKKTDQLKAVIEKAEKDGFQYIICRISPQSISHIRLLESLHFYLSDIGVTWAITTSTYSFRSLPRNRRTSDSVKVAVGRDIPGIKKLAASLFTDSRFYSDPFFSKKEANNFFSMWIENSVRQIAADVVLHIPDTGFVSCKKRKDGKGEIVLIGVKKGLQNKRTGTILVEEAVKWFMKEKIDSVSVRSQVKNVKAMNFYLKAGFSVKGYDISFSKIL